jgi:alpha-1,2-mannosyltransferase
MAFAVRTPSVSTVVQSAKARAADAWALSLNALAMLLVSPIAWSHHWVWGETAVLTLALFSWQERRRGGLALAGRGLACFAIAPQWLFPSGGNREFQWTGWEQAFGSSYVAWALAVLATSARNSCRSRKVWPPDPLGFGGQYRNGWRGRATFSRRRLSRPSSRTSPGTSRR